MRIISSFTLILFLSLPAAMAANHLRIYFIDVEGGAATLIVSPSGESLLADTGNPLPDDRDAKRIYAATQQAGLKKIDYLVTTHFDGDHSGGVAALVKLILPSLVMRRTLPWAAVSALSARLPSASVAP